MWRSRRSNWADITTTPLDPARVDMRVIEANSQLAGILSRCLIPRRLSKRLTCELMAAEFRAQALIDIGAVGADTHLGPLVRLSVECRSGLDSL